MISDINKSIKDKLLEVYPSITIYDEKVPQKFTTPSFFISIIDHNYEKRLSDKYNSTLSYDIAYFPNEEYSKNNEMYSVQETLLKQLDSIGSFRPINKKANITDDVLHLLFDIKYSEILVRNEVKMQTKEINSYMKEVKLNGRNMDNSK